MMKFRTIASILAAAGLAASAHAGTPTLTPLVMAGDFYGQGAIVSGFSSSETFVINNSGQWAIEAVIGFAPENLSLIIRGEGTTLPGTVYLSEGDATGAPAGATISSFDGVRLNNSGNMAFNLFFDGLTSTTDSGVYFNQAMVIQEGNFTTSSAHPPMTPFTGWFDAFINDQNQILMIASLDDPTISGVANRALIRIDDPAGAATQTPLALAGAELIPGSGRLFVDLVSTGPHATDFASNSRVITAIDLDGSTADDTGIMMFDGTSWSYLAREGDPSPAVPGRNWANISSTVALDMNEAGDWAAKLTLNAPTSDDLVIVKNGTTVIAREGMNVPGLSGGPFQFTAFGSGAVKIDNAGNVFYFGDWNDPDTSRDTGLFRNNELLVQESVTMIGDELITDISGVQDNFSISDNGRYLLFEAELTNTFTLFERRGTIMLDFGDETCPADFNGVGGVTVQDIFDFLAAYFANDPSADFNGAGGITVQDIFDFLAAYFAGC